MSESVTELLAAYRAGDPKALDDLTRLLYPELKRMAGRRVRSTAGAGATTLVNETFLKLLAGGTLQPGDRREFFALTAAIMRQVIVDEIRRATAEKRAHKEVTLAETVIGDDSHEKAQFLLYVDEMMTLLEREDERLARVFECRYFAGLTTAETAEAIGTSARTAERLWSASRSRMAELIEERGEPGSQSPVPRSG